MDARRSPVRTPLVLVLVQVLVQVLVLVLVLGLPPAHTWDLVILHTNDVHARVEETSALSGRCPRGADCFAGVARRATAVRRVRSAEPAVLLLDAGDQFQGTVWFNYYKGAEAAHFMNKMRYDAMVLGNHEFDIGVTGLMKPFLENVNCSILSANIKTDKTLASTFGTTYLPYKIFTFGEQKVAVVGYTSRETPALSRPGPHLTFEDEVTVLQQQVEKLSRLNINKIIALGHSGFKVDQEIARKVRGVDVVVGGHTNTFLFTGSPPSTEVPAGSYPFMVTAEDGRRVPVVQAYAFGKYLGNLRVSFDDKGDVVKTTGNPILLDHSVEQDPEVLAEVEEWKKKLASYSSQEVGKTLVFLNGTTEACRSQECNLGNLICDAMLDSNIRVSDDQQWNHVSAAIYNGGGIRTSIDERVRNGWITTEDVIAAVPFGGTFDLIQLNGSILREAFEHSVKRYGQRAGEFLQVSGLHVEFDVSRPPGHRVKSLSILCTKCRDPHYEAVQDQTVYTVVVPSYMVIGGDGFSVIRDGILKHDSGDLDLSVLSNYIQQRQRVYPSVEGRIKIYNWACGLHNTPLVLLASLLLWSLCGSV